MVFCLSFLIIIGVMCLTCDADTVHVGKDLNYEKAVTVTQASLDVTYRNTTNIGNEFHYVYHLDLGMMPPRSVRLRVEVENPSASVRKPVRVTARFNKGTSSWNVPLDIGKIKFDFIEHTLCLMEASDIGMTDVSPQDVVVIVSTASSNDLKFTLKLFEVDRFSLLLNQEMKLTHVGPSSPAFHFINLSQTPKDNLLQVKVSSDDNFCAIVSVQPFTCPASDTVESIRKEGYFQTMLNIASFTIDQNKFDDSGIFVVFLVLENDVSCGNMTTPTTHRAKNFRFKLSDKLSRQKIAWEVTATVGVMFILAVFAIVATFCCSVYNEPRRREETVTENGFEETDGHLHEDDQQNKVGCCLLCRHKSYNIHPVDTSMNSQEAPRTEHSSHVPKFVVELSKKANDTAVGKKIKSMFQKSGLYMWLVLSMGIFYGIPAIQLVMNYQEKLLQSGDADMCYYNFLCSIPVYNVVDFNHIFSNIGYLFFGLNFLLITGYKEIQHNKSLKSEEANVEQEAVELNSTSPKREYGIPQHFGIFYAMAFALIFEGILSACYHVCPTNENFQFDTTFMYLIAVLCFMKIYQFRHPDVTSNAYKVFSGIALVMFLEVLGIFYQGNLFWILSLVIYFVTMILLTAIIYHSGTWALRPNIFVKIFNSLLKLWKNKKCSESYSLKRLIFVVLLNVVNIAFLIYGGIYQPGISTYLLMIFIANLVIYTVYYTSLKFYHHEKIRPAPMFYALLSLVCWVPAMYFFLDSQKSTDVTPAESRNLNKECVFLDLYDNHDIWHFFSAAGLFFSFMFLITLDDGLIDTPREKIIIF